MGVLIDLDNNINIMHPVYNTKLDLYIKKINVSMLKIGGSYIDTFKIVIANRLLKKKLEKLKFFLIVFLLANISLEISLKIFFFHF